MGKKDQELARLSQKYKKLEADFKAVTMQLQSTEMELGAKNGKDS